MNKLYHKDMYQFHQPVKSYWEHTIENKKIKFNKLQKQTSADIVVIGGGYTGLSCSLQLTQKYNQDVILLEAGHIGWGSSARNAGFCCISPTKHSIHKMKKLYGIEETKKFYATTIEGSHYTKELIENYNINCDVTGNCNFEVAHHPSFFESIKEEAETYSKEFGIETQVFTKDEFNEIGHGGNEQFGAFSYKPGFAINPIKFQLGLAKESQNSGVKIFENSPVIKIEKQSNKYKVITNHSSIIADKIVMTTNGFYKDDLIPQLNDRILPVISNIIVTRPLTQEELDSHNYKTINPVLNSRNLLFYYRLLKDKRFLFGARGDLTGSNISGNKMFLEMEKKMKTVFPNWLNVKIDFKWRGFVAVTTKFTPSIGKLEDDEIFYSFGYQANGVNTAPWAGKELANLIVSSNNKKFPISKLYQGLPKKFPFPFLRLLYLRLAYFYYGIIDK